MADEELTAARSPGRAAEDLGLVRQRQHLSLATIGVRGDHVPKSAGEVRLVGDKPLEHDPAVRARNLGSGWRGRYDEGKSTQQRESGREPRDARTVPRRPSRSFEHGVLL